MPTLMNTLDPEARQKLADRFRELDSGCGGCGKTGTETAETGEGGTPKQGCPDYLPDESVLNPVGCLIKKGFYNALDVCFAELGREPEAPKKILVIGGCRQRDMARRLGFMLPFTKIVVLDTDEAEVSRAEEEIRCRFQFAYGRIESLDDYPDRYFDVTLAHNIFEYATDWPVAMAEMARVTQGYVLIGRQSVQGAGWFFVKNIPGIQAALTHLGCLPPRHQPSYDETLHTFRQHAEVTSLVHPFPWTLIMGRRKGT